MRDESVKIRVTEEEKMVMQKVAKVGGYKGISDMIRKLVSEEAKRVSEQYGVDIVAFSEY